MKSHKLIIQIIFAGICFIAVSCRENIRQTAEIKESEVLPEDIVELRADQIKLADIQTGPIEMRSLCGSLKVSGIVATAPQNHASISMPMGGFVISTSLIPGNKVTKGQTLAILENQEFIDIQENFLESRVKLEFAEAEFNRTSELYKNDVYSQKNLQLVTSDYKSLKAKVNALKQKLEMIGIDPGSLHEDNISRSVAVVSPISGFVTMVNINPGKFVSPTDVLFEIVNHDKLLLELTLFEKDANKVSAGQKIRFFINNETEQHDAVIYQTGKSISSDKTYKVYASVPDACKNVLPGMYVNAVIEGSSNKVAAVPTDAVVGFDDKFYIFIFDKNKLEDGKAFTEYRMIEVGKGVSDDGFTEITLPEGVDPGAAKVVTKGAYNLLSAMKNAGEMSC